MRPMPSCIWHDKDSLGFRGLSVYGITQAVMALGTGQYQPAYGMRKTLMDLGTGQYGMTQTVMAFWTGQ